MKISENTNVTWVDPLGSNYSVKFQWTDHWN